MTRLPLDIIGDLRRMQEEIRQLRLRPDGNNGYLEPFQSIESYLNPGWSTPSATGSFASQNARCYQDRGRTWFAGLIVLDSVTAGNALHPISGLPSGYAPALFENGVQLIADPYNSPTGLSREYWVAQVSTSGVFTILGNGNFPGDGSPPVGTTFLLNPVSFRHA